MKQNDYLTSNISVEMEQILQLGMLHRIAAVHCLFLQYLLAND